MRSVEIAIVIWPNSYERIVYLKRCIDALREKLVGDCEFVWTCNSESERRGDDWYGDDLESLCEAMGVTLNWNMQAADLGVNMNGIFERTSADFVFITQDDHILNRRLDITPGIDVLLEYPQIVSVWYDWLPNMISSCGMVGEFRINSFVSPCLLVDRGMLLRSGFPQEYGRFREGGPFGVVEMDLNRKLKRLGATVLCSTEIYFDDEGGVRTVPVDGRYFG